MPDNPDVNLQDVVTLCKQDALDACRSTPEFFTLANESLRDTVEALITPIVTSRGYTIAWDTSASVVGAAEAQTTNGEAVTNEG